MNLGTVLDDGILVRQAGTALKMEKWPGNKGVIQLVLKWLIHKTPQTTTQSTIYMAVSTYYCQRDGCQYIVIVSSLPHVWST